jgi:hypothetical protein
MADGSGTELPNVFTSEAKACAPNKYVSPVRKSSINIPDAVARAYPEALTESRGTKSGFAKSMISVVGP